MPTKICIASLSNRGFKSETVKSLLELTIPYDKHVVIATQGYTIAENRTYMVVQAIKANCTHILMVDDDMIFPPDTLQRMMKHDKDIMGVVYHSKMFPPKPVVVLEDGEVIDYTKDLPDLMKCQHVGGGVLLINLDVFNKINKPWFDFKRHESGMTIMGEDAWFCSQARGKGYDVWTDTTLKIKHIGDFSY